MILNLSASWLIVGPSVIFGLTTKILIFERGWNLGNTTTVDVTVSFEATMSVTRLLTAWETAGKGVWMVHVGRLHH